MEKLSITAVILTYNESNHIERCIRSLTPLIENIVVIDSYSKDDTVFKAESLGAHVFKNPWVNYSNQFQWALDNVEMSTDWIFRIDADEYLDPKNSKNLRALSSLSPDISGVYIKRKYFFMGKWIKHGTMYPITHLRIWRKGFGRIESRWMDEHIVLENGKSTHIDVDIIDDNKNDITWWTEKHNSYATRETIDNLNLRYDFMPRDKSVRETSSAQTATKRAIKENIYGRMPLFIRPIIYFIYRYIIRLGFLDGIRGFGFHFLHAFWYRVLVDIKQYEAEKLIIKTTDKHQILEILEKHTALKLT
ncbi:MAG: glycosyltransferase family 2 protein [Cellvibrionaceae bacterium]